MSTTPFTFDDFSSSKMRQKRVTQLAVSMGLLCAVIIIFKFFSIEKQSAVPAGALATVDSMDGTVFIKRGAETVEYEPGFIVLAGDTFQTIGESQAVISYLGDGTKASLGPYTTLLFNGNVGGKRTNLSSGTVVFDIPPQPDDRPMVLASYNADATVREAGVIIQTYSGLSTHFEVKSGALQVRRYSDGRISDLSAGQAHTCQPDDGGIIKFNPDGID